MQASQIAAFFIIFMCNIHSMANKTETKKALIEVIFWFVFLILANFLFSYLRSTTIDFDTRLHISTRSAFFSAILLTLVNRLLQSILKRVK